MMNRIELLKDPVLRHKLATPTDQPAGFVLDEIEENEACVRELASGGNISDLSKKLGNTGSYCTLTKECQWICQIIL